MTQDCRCRRAPFAAADYDARELGSDRYGADVSIETCRRCGTHWLRYFLEAPHHGRSGRWWRVCVPASLATGLAPCEARAYVASQEAGFRGGSFFGSSGEPFRGPIRIR